MATEAKLSAPFPSASAAADATEQLAGSRLTRLLAFERRWALAALKAFAPERSPGLSPAPDEVDYLRTTQRMLRGVTPMAALGLRLAIWIVALAPIWLWGKLTTISSLANERRSDLLQALLVHRLFAVRELVLLLKLCAAMALLGTPSVRARSGYDHVVQADIESGVRLRLTQHPSLPPPRDGQDSAREAS